MLDKELIFRAVGLFYLTIELDSIEFDPQDSYFSGLYEMECELFNLMDKMSFEEKEAYQKLINHGLK